MPKHGHTLKRTLARIRANDPTLTSLLARFKPTKLIWIIRALVSNTTITYLELYDCDLDVGCARELARMFRVNRTITNLHIRDMSLSPGVARELAQIARETRALIDICLHNITSAANSGVIDEIARGLRDSVSIMRVQLSRTMYERFGHVSTIAEIARMIRDTKTIQILYLNTNQITSADMQEIALALRANTSLRYLSVESNYYGEQGVRAINDALRVNTTIEIVECAWSWYGVSRVHIAEERKSAIRTRECCLAFLRGMQLPINAQSSPLALLPADYSIARAIFAYCVVDHFDPRIRIA